MDSNSISTSRFRFRDHNQDLADNDDSSEGHTSADSSSISSNGNEEPELQSMTAKGVQYLCSELLELKQESDEDFQKDILLNYSTFIAIWKEIEGVQSEVLGLKKQASSQQSLVKDVSHVISLKVLSEETIDSVLEEQIHVQPSSPSTLETHTENISDILDTLLSEHRLDDAVALLEMESEFFEKLRSGEIFSSDQIMFYNSTIFEKRAMLSDQFILEAKHPRVSAPELQKALSGLCKLGDNHLATQLLLQYYNSRIVSGTHNLQSSNHFLDVLHLRGVAKYVFSMISQAMGSFVALNGEICPYPPEVIQWTREEVEVFAACFIRYVASIYEVSGRLSTTVSATKIAMSYCSLLETQRIFLQPTLVEKIHPCVEEVLRTHIDHLKEVISIFTSTDNWVLGRYSSSGILTGSNYAIVDRQPECYFLTNSGRKFVTLFQSVADDIFPLINMQMESSVLKGLIDLFTSYIFILKDSLFGETGAIQKEISRINLPESPTQQAVILANLSTLMQFSSRIIRNIFYGFHQLETEIKKHLMFVQGIYVQLITGFLEKFISNIFSSNAGDDYGPESGVSYQEHSTIYDLIPSVPYLELYLELKKLQQLAEDDCVDTDWLNYFLREVMKAAFGWISSKPEVRVIDRDNLPNHRVEFLQRALDTQFLVETARCGGYLTDHMISMSSSILCRLEDSFISAGLDPLRDSDDEEWPAKAAVRALEKLQGHEHTSTEREESNQSGPQAHNSAIKSSKSSPKSARSPVLESSGDASTLIVTHIEVNHLEQNSFSDMELDRDSDTVLYRQDIITDAQHIQERST